MFPCPLGLTGPPPLKEIYTTLPWKVEHGDAPAVAHKSGGLKRLFATNNRRTAMFSLRALTAAAITALFAATRTTATVTDCNSHSIFRPTELAMTPDPPIPGQLVSLTVKFDNPGPTVTAGTSDTTIVLNGLPVASKHEDLCINTWCPISTGANDRSTNMTWPTDPISGKLVTQNVWIDETGQSLMCVKITNVFASQNNLRGKALVVAE